MLDPPFVTAAGGGTGRGGPPHAKLWSARGESSGVLSILTPRRGRPAGRRRRQATVGVQVSALITLTSCIIDRSSLAPARAVQNDQSAESRVLYGTSHVDSSSRQRLGPVAVRRHRRALAWSRSALQSAPLLGPPTRPTRALTPQHMPQPCTPSVVATAPVAHTTFFAPGTLIPCSPKARSIRSSRLRLFVSWKDPWSASCT